MIITHNFIMLIGLPASGKSTYSKNNGIYISSDEIRKELFGNESIQGDGVFELINRRIVEILKTDDLIYDATNISYKRRMSLLQFIKSKVDVCCIAKLIYTDYSDCLIRNRDRDRHVPEDVIRNMYKNFDIPYYYISQRILLINILWLFIINYLYALLFV